MNSITIIYLILALVVSATIAFFYYKKQGQRGILQYVFTALRFLVLLSVFILLINPKIKHASYRVTKPTLAVLVDNSSSIATLADSTFVQQQINSFINDKALQEKFDVEIYQFDEAVTSDAGIHFNGKNTNISKALQSVDKIYTNEVAPVVLFSDGNQTYGTDYSYSAQTLAQPVYTVVVGDTTAYKDLKIGAVNVNKYAFYKNEFPVEIFLKYQGKQNQKATFKITNGKQTVFQQELEFSAQQLSHKINTTLKATTIGVQQYKAELSFLEDEKNTANNTKQFAVEVLDERTKVAIISEIMHPDLGAFKKSIESNQQRSVRILKPSEIKDLNEYQLVVLYQPTSAFKQVFEIIEQLEKNYFVVTGSKTDWNFLNSNQTIIHKNAAATEEIQGVYNTNFSSFLLNEMPFSSFPPLKGHLGAVNFSGEASIVLQQKVRNITLEDPLLVTVEKNKRRFAYLLGENSWQWRAKSYLETGDFKEYDEFLGKLVFYLASNKKKERLQINAETFYYGTVGIDAAYFDKNYQFDANATLNIRIENTVTGTSERFHMLLKNAYFEFNTNILPEGTYKYTVSVEGENISKSGNFTVIGYDVEAQFYNANYSKLENLSTQTKATTILLNNVASLQQLLSEDENYKPIQKSKASIEPIINWEALLFLLIGLLAIEWFLRKYNGLV